MMPVSVYIRGFCYIILLLGSVHGDKKRLICQPEDEIETEKDRTILTDDVVKAINSLIDSKLKELERKVEENIWRKMMDVTLEASTTETALEHSEKTCDFKYEDKCFSFFHAEVMTYNEAKQRCNDVKGHMANIYNKIHEDIIVDFVKKLDVGPVFFFIGMRIDISTMKVSLHDGSLAPYVHWYPDGGYPEKNHALIRYTLLPTFSGMFNNVDERLAKSNGVLCEF